MKKSELFDSFLRMYTVMCDEYNVHVEVCTCGSENCNGVYLMTHEKDPSGYLNHLEKLRDSVYAEEEIEAGNKL